jgi:hypothetical protein
MTCLEDTKAVCLGFACLFQLAIAGSSVAYVVFAIIFLVKDYNICGDASPLWIFVLVSLCGPVFLNFVRLQTQPTNKNPEDTDTVTPVAGGMLLISEVVVGGILLYKDGQTCESMKHTGLWVVALVLFWTLLSVCLLIIVLGFMTCAVGLLGTLETAAPEATKRAAGVVDPNNICVTIVSGEESV